VRRRRAGDQPERLHQPPLRPEQGFRAGDHGRLLAAHPGGQSRTSGEVGQGIDRAGEGQARQAQLRGEQRRQRAAPGRRDFASRAGINWAYIPYKGGAQAITDVIGGQADVLFNGMLATYPHVKSGKLRILAVSSANRMAAIPEVPTVAESGVPGFETGSWQGVLAPAGTPREVVARINADYTRVLNTPEMRDKLSGQGAEVRVNTPETFAVFLRDETARWAKVVSANGVKLE
jgi:tripartite-type tricarboxylate transporter receptor subunit TctC